MHFEKILQVRFEVGDIIYIVDKEKPEVISVKLGENHVCKPKYSYDTQEPLYKNFVLGYDNVKIVEDGRIDLYYINRSGNDPKVEKLNSDRYVAYIDYEKAKALFCSSLDFKERKTKYHDEVAHKISELELYIKDLQLKYEVPSSFRSQFISY